MHETRLTLVAPPATRYSKDLFTGLFAGSGMTAPVLATLVALAGSLIGMWLTGASRRARVVVPFSAGVLVGVAAFFLLPELISELGWPAALLLVAGGYALLFGINRYVYPVCPTCSHDHNHNECATVLHGFAAPLVSATALHAFLDGWGITTAEGAATAGVRVLVPVAIALHKLPEGIALGGILRASMKSRLATFGWCVLAEGTTVIGGAVGLALAPHLGVAWVSYPLGLAAGVFVYLGTHAVHEEWKRRGPAPAFVPALTGAAGAAVLQQGVHALLR